MLTKFSHPVQLCSFFVVFSEEFDVDVMKALVLTRGFLIGSLAKAMCLINNKKIKNVAGLSEIDWAEHPVFVESWSLLKNLLQCLS